MKGFRSSFDGNDDNDNFYGDVQASQECSFSYLVFYFDFWMPKKLAYIFHRMNVSK